MQIAAIGVKKIHTTGIGFRIRLGGNSDESISDGDAIGTTESGPERGEIDVRDERRSCGISADEVLYTPVLYSPRTESCRLCAETDTARSMPITVGRIECIKTVRIESFMKLLLKMLNDNARKMLHGC